MDKTKVQNRSTKNDPVIRELPLACADEKAAVEFMEKQRGWHDHAFCPECGGEDVYKMISRKTGERPSHYRWRCRDCNKQYTVRTATVFEDSRIPMRHWCFAFWRAATSKKGVSALEIHRQTGVSYKSSLFMLHRIRFAMADIGPDTPLSGNVEVDETFVGGKPRHRNNSYKNGPRKKKAVVLGMVERGGRLRPKVIPDVTGATLKEAIRENIDSSSTILTDEGSGYRGIGKEYAGGHRTVRHSTYEYARREEDMVVHTNTIEGFFGIFKRGLNGVYHSVSKEHLHRYVSEFEFRYNHRELEDGERTLAAIRGAEGKRLRYETVASK